MSPDLPAPLRAALDRALEGVPRKGLAERAARTSEAYRAGRPSSGVFREADDALAYALTRRPPPMPHAHRAGRGRADGPGFRTEEPAGRRGRDRRGELGGVGGLGPARGPPGSTRARRSWPWPPSSPPTDRLR